MVIKVLVDEGEEEGEDSVDGLWGDVQELLVDGRGFLVQGVDDSGEEESYVLNGDVVEQEDEGNFDCYGGGYVMDQFGFVNVVNDFGLIDMFRFDMGNVEFFFFFRELVGGFRVVSEGSEGEDVEVDSDDVFDDEDYVLCFGVSERVYVEDIICEQGIKGISKGSGNYVKCKVEVQFGMLVLMREVVGNVGKYISFENIEEEVDIVKLGFGVNVVGVDVDDVEVDSGGGEELIGFYLFIVDCGWNFEDNVGDVEDRDDGVIVLFVYYVKFFLQISELSIV